MKKLLLILLCLPIIGLGQINIGFDQTICFGDSAEVIASIQGGGQGVGVDTDVNGCVGEELTILVNVIINSVEDINNNRELIKITDVLGRESKEKNNVTLFYIFDDGTVEKRIIME